MCSQITQCVTESSSKSTNANLPVNTKRAGPPLSCKCGGTDHQRISSKKCPLYKPRLKYMRDGPDPRHHQKTTTCTVNKGFVATLVQQELGPVIMDSVARCTDIHCEASRFLNGYVIWILDSFKLYWLSTPTAFIVENLSETRQLMTIQFCIRPAVPLRCDAMMGAGLGQLISNMARQHSVNCQNHVSTNLKKWVATLLNFKLTKHLGFMCDSEQIDKLKSYALAEVAKRPEDQNMTRFPQDVWYAVGNEDEQQLLLIGLDHVILKAKIKTEGKSLEEAVIGPVWWTYLKVLKNVLKTFLRHNREDAEERLITRRRGRGLRLFSLVPIGKLRQKHILVDTDALHDLYRMADMEVPPKPEFRNQAAVWWRRAFDVDSVTTANRRFGYSLSTDGVQVSLHLMKPFQEAGVNDWGFDFDGAYHPLEVGPNTNVVGLDGGRRCLYTTVSGEGRDDVQMCRNVRWQEISGSTYAKKKKAVWMRHDPQMQAWITLIPTPRCMTHDAYHAHLTPPSWNTAGIQAVCFG
ncbi:hypothetical protein MP228_004317 [Amoeboaphelidium protococcarum]|nr:hypothetical protein MP228_004317 [Amoeboaphelidium protococcarum]